MSSTDGGKTAGITLGVLVFGGLIAVGGLCLYYGVFNQNSFGSGGRSGDDPSYAEVVKKGTDARGGSRSYNTFTNGNTGGSSSAQGGSSSTGQGSTGGRRRSPGNGGGSSDQPSEPVSDVRPGATDAHGNDENRDIGMSDAPALEAGAKRQNQL
jgi:hypothetical protein